ncbi:hypothetical protein NPIL_364441 [Nephila pilipes]|uniref:Uncharacterized protein n=1 Tax=Nephila pilipes TaxID=299642 RepID=A0A8X6QXJ0_NEPPI|nr:hypothetical protein NPIL_364441 [Nephila pilipes]
MEYWIEAQSHQRPFPRYQLELHHFLGSPRRVENIWYGVEGKEGGTLPALLTRCFGGTWNLSALIVCLGFLFGSYLDEFSLGLSTFVEGLGVCFLAAASAFLFISIFFCDLVTIRSSAAMLAR